MCWELCEAIKRGSLELVRQLVESGSSVDDVEAIYPTNWTPLQFAHDNEEITRFLLDKGASLCWTSDRKTALHLASQKGNVKVVRLYLDRGIDIDLYADTGSPLYYASSSGKLDVAQLLLDRGADANLWEGCQRPLHSACYEGTLAMVHLLVDRGADVNAKDEDWETPLARTCQSSACSVDVARLLLERGAKMEKDLLIGLNHLDMLEFLVEKGANPNVRSNDGEYTPLTLACEFGKEATVRFLVDRAGANVDGIEEEEDTRPLHVAIRHGRTMIARFLIDRGADVTATQSDGETPLTETIFMDNLPSLDEDSKLEFFRLLLDRSAAVLDSKVRGETALHIASRRAESEMVQMLVDEGADVDALDDEGNTPLLSALQDEMDDISDVVKLLLGRGAAVATKSTEKNETVLHVAVQRRREEEIVRMLLDHGADVEAQDDNLDTPLHQACEKRELEIVQLLLDGGAPVNVKNGKGEMPLHLLCCDEYERPDARIAKLLLDRGSDVNAMDENGKTALHLVCEKHYDDHVPTEIVQLLLDRSADVEAKTKDGLIPMHLACQKRNWEFVWLFVRRYPWLVMSHSFPSGDDRSKTKRQRRSS